VTRLCPHAISNDPAACAITFRANPNSRQGARLAVRCQQQIYRMQPILFLRLPQLTLG
jgi:hypothetical protein